MIYIAELNSILFFDLVINPKIYSISIDITRIIFKSIVAFSGSLEKNILITVRPWPFFVGPKLKLHNFTASFEIGLNNEFSAASETITTLGYRRPL